MPGPTAIAVDWSGTRKTNRASGIWLAVVRGGRLVQSRAVATREEIVAFVLDAAPPVVAGFDFSFSVPAWFADQHGCRTIDDVWARVARDGETWLGPPPAPPFWRDAGCAPPVHQRFRACEERLRQRRLQPKSIFQLVGTGQVGAGSIRGMPHVARLRAAGFAVWPFDDATARTVVEIYPSLLRQLVPHDDGAFASEHERDAVLSARAMWRHRDLLTNLTAATDPVTRIEGDVWTPPMLDAATTSGPPALV